MPRGNSCSLYEILAVFCTEICCAIPSTLDMNRGREQPARDQIAAWRVGQLLGTAHYRVRGNQAGATVALLAKPKASHLASG
jgi:hypothetical protein